MKWLRYLAPKGKFQWGVAAFLLGFHAVHYASALIIGPPYEFKAGKPIALVIMVTYALISGYCYVRMKSARTFWRD